MLSSVLAVGCIQWGRVTDMVVKSVAQAWKSESVLGLVMGVASVIAQCGAGLTVVAGQGEEVIALVADLTVLMWSVASVADQPIVGAVGSRPSVLMQVVRGAVVRAVKVGKVALVKGTVAFAPCAGGLVNVDYHDGVPDSGVVAGRVCSVLGRL